MAPRTCFPESVTCEAAGVSEVIRNVLLLQSKPYHTAYHSRLLLVAPRPFYFVCENLRHLTSVVRRMLRPLISSQSTSYMVCNSSISRQYR